MAGHLEDVRAAVTDTRLQAAAEALDEALAALKAIAQLGSEERDRVTAQAAIDRCEALAGLRDQGDET